MEGPWFIAYIQCALNMYIYRLIKQIHLSNDEFFISKLGWFDPEQLADQRM